MFISIIARLESQLQMRGELFQPRLFRLATKSASGVCQPKCQHIGQHPRKQERETGILPPVNEDPSTSGTLIIYTTPVKTIAILNFAFSPSWTVLVSITTHEGAYHTRMTSNSQILSLNKDCTLTADSTSAK